ncbi:peptide chain release factor 2 [bacterium]|nr:peptide chain release factor 2 [bacterium]
MDNLNELKEHLKDLEKKLNDLGGLFDVDKKYEEIKALEEKLNDSSIWSDQSKYNEINSNLTILKKEVEDYNVLSKQLEEAKQTLELLAVESDLDLYNELVSLINSISTSLESLELNTLLNGEFDKNKCYLEIHPGAGGTESQDWADMLLRMYTMYFSKNDIPYEIVDKQDANDAGIKSVTIYVKKIYSYGYLKGEIGVHRLVRISPFDSNHRRHTSFAAVNVTPEIEDANIEINDDDIRVDVYRSSGNGGQGVNTTDSAVRITHFPSGIVVTVQNERSQIRNKETAMKILKSKLYKIKMDEQNKMLNSIKGNSSIDFGSQIRNYVLEPYSLVKDLRSGYESNNPTKILDGDIGPIIESVLKSR